MLPLRSLTIRGSFEMGSPFVTKPFDRLLQYARLVFVVQLGLILLVAVIAFYSAGGDGVKSAIAGGVAALMSTLVSLRRARVAGALVEASPNAAMATLYWGFFQKAAIVSLIVVAGWKLFELDPLYIFVSLGIAQLAYLAPLIRA